MILSTHFAEKIQHDEVCAVLSHAGYLGGIVVISGITEVLASRASPKGASLLVYSILHIRYMHHTCKDRRTCADACTSKWTCLLQQHIHMHINHTHFTFVCTSILTLSKIESFAEHQETCRKVKSPCKYTTQSVSKSTDI